VNKFKKWCWALVLIGALIGLKTAIFKGIYEWNHRTVDQLISYKEAQRLCVLSHEDRDKFYTQLHQTGITSLILEEDTLTDLVNTGRVTVFRGSEIMNLYRVGYVNQHLMTYVYQQTPIKPDYYYLFTDEKDIFDRMCTHLQNELSAQNVKRIGQWLVLEVKAEWDDLKPMGFGVSSALTQELRGYGFGIWVRLKPQSYPNANSITQKWNELNDIEGLQGLFFEGPTLPGNTSLLATWKNLIKNSNQKVAFIEFYDQAGLKQVLKNNTKNAIKLHTILDNELPKMTFEKAQDRYIRAVKERGLSVIWLRVLFMNQGNNSALDANRLYWTTIRTTLAQNGIYPGDVQSNGILPYAPNVFEVLGLILGSLGLVGLLFSHFFSKITWVEWTGMAFWVLALWSLHLLHRSEGLLIPAFLVACTTPALAMISAFKTPSHLNFLVFFKKLGLALGMTSLGCLLMTGFLAQPIFITGIEVFSGVKLAFLAPLLIVYLFWFVQPHRVHALNYLLQRFLKAPVRWITVVLGMVLIIIAGLYILRSGNYALSATAAEGSVRSWLETLLWVRPRTKEWLFGYPLLVLTTGLGVSWFTPTLRKWGLVLSTIALVSVVNSFCHSHTWILASSLRSILGCILGLVLGFLALTLLSLLHRWTINK